ncbi:MAG: cupin domain-containing protein [Pseudomonadota bacterium]
MTKQRLDQYPVHLGVGARIVPQPAFDGMSWYQGYGERHGEEGVEGRLVTVHHFDTSWDTWEIHPHGDELVMVLAGTMTLLQEFGDRIERVGLSAGEYAINPPGVWHTADVDGPVSALFITAGLGTENRDR